MKEKDLRRYLRQANSCLACSPEHRREFERFVRRSFADLAAENPKAGFETWEKQFGTPESTAEQFMADLPPEEVESWRRRRTLKRRAAGVAAALLIAVLAGLCLYYYQIKGMVLVERTQIIQQMIPKDASSPTALAAGAIDGAVCFNVMI